MKMRKRKKVVNKYKHNPDKFISTDELNQRILDLRILIAKRWLEDSAKHFAQVANQTKAQLEYPKDE